MVKARFRFGEQVVLERSNFSKRVLNLWERDRGLCHLCGGLVLLTVGAQHPAAPSADHLLPQSLGYGRRLPGATTSNNVALAHRWCNSKRGHELPQVDQDEYGQGLAEAVRRAA